MHECAIWSAVGRGRDSKETSAQSSLFSPGRVRRASARGSPCLTPAVGRHSVTDGRGVTLSRRAGNSLREASRGAKQSSQRLCHQNIKSDTCTIRERACVPDVQHHKHHTGCGRASATARHTHMVSYIHFISFHFISFHFISFHFISFHFISFHFISFHFISFHFISFHFISFHFISFHFISFHFISFHFISFHFISFHFISFHFISFHFISFHFISFHFISFHFISFHFISFHFISLTHSLPHTHLPTH